MSSFKCCKNFSLKINFSESNILEVYAVVHYIFPEKHTSDTQSPNMIICIYIHTWYEVHDGTANNEHKTYSRMNNVLYSSSLFLFMWVTTH